MLRFLIMPILLTLAGCSYVSQYTSNHFPEPPPQRADALPHYEAIDVSLHLGLRIEDERGPILPVLVQATNNSDSVWTIDAGQLTQELDDGSCDIKPIPVEEAARMATITAQEQVGPIVEQMGTFATYSAALGAVTGAIGARAKGDSIVNAVQINTAIGGAIGAVLGAIYEVGRLDFTSESPEAGQINEKMKFLALSDRSTLYQGYSASGYVYFSERNSSEKSGCTKRMPGKSHIRMLVTLGDPSKDWGGTGSGGGDTYRSPTVCECSFSSNGQIPSCGPIGISRNNDLSRRCGHLLPYLIPTPPRN